MTIKKSIGDLTNNQQKDGVYEVSDLGISFIVIHVNLVSDAVQFAVINNELFYRIKNKSENSAFEGFINCHYTPKKQANMRISIDISKLPAAIKAICEANNIVRVNVIDIDELAVVSSSITDSNTNFQESPIKKMMQSVSNTNNQDNEFFRFVNNLPNYNARENKVMYIANISGTNHSIKTDKYIVVEFKNHKGRMIKTSRGYAGSTLVAPNNEMIFFQNSEYKKYSFPDKWTEDVSSNGYFNITTFPTTGKTYYADKPMFVELPNVYRLRKLGNNPIEMTSMQFINAHAPLYIGSFTLSGGYLVQVSVIGHFNEMREGIMTYISSIVFTLNNVPLGAPGTTIELTGTMQVCENNLERTLIGAIPVTLSITNTPTGGVID